MALTVKQAAWDLFKVENPNVRQRDRGVAVTVAEVRKKVPCTCRHSPKRHTKSGHCRNSCECAAGTR